MIGVGVREKGDRGKGGKRFLVAPAVAALAAVMVSGAVNTGGVKLAPGTFSFTVAS